MHFVITAKIQVFSSTSTLLPSAVFPEGGWKATLRPSCKGSCFASASLRAFGSRENGIAGDGPVDPRIEAAVVARGAPVTGGVTEVDVGDGEGGLGRLLRFSVGFLKKKIRESLNERKTLWQCFRCLSECD